LCQYRQRVQPLALPSQLLQAFSFLHLPSVCLSVLVFLQGHFCIKSVSFVNYCGLKSSRVLERSSHSCRNWSMEISMVKGGTEWEVALSLVFTAAKAPNPAISCKCTHFQFQYKDMQSFECSQKKDQYFMNKNVARVMFTFRCSRINLHFVLLTISKLLRCAFSNVISVALLCILKIFHVHSKPGVFFTNLMPLIANYLSCYN
jgi:hypothetical protein